MFAKEPDDAQVEVTVKRRSVKAARISTKARKFSANCDEQGGTKGNRPAAMSGFPRRSSMKLLIWIACKPGPT
jgi:hypothetical protein